MQYATRYTHDMICVRFHPESITNIFSCIQIRKSILLPLAGHTHSVAHHHKLHSLKFNFFLFLTIHKLKSEYSTLPHSIDAEDSDVCLFVKDLKRGRRLDFEPTIKHFEGMLRQKKVERNLTIIPLNQLYNDYATFELRRKLTYLYDRFLVDKEIATHVNGFLGHKLLSKCRSAIPINLAADNLNEEIDTSMRKVFYKHVNTGITQSVLVGRHSMSDEAISENIIDLVKQLAQIHPGSTENIYKLHLKPNVNVSVSVPIYVNLGE